MGEQSDAQGSDMSARLAMCWKNVTPTDNNSVLKRNKLTMVVRDDVSKKGICLLRWWCLEEREVSLLAGDIVEGISQPFKMRFGSGNNREFHSGAQCGIDGLCAFVRRSGCVVLENRLTTYLGFHGISDKALFMGFMVHLMDLLPRG